MAVSKGLFPSLQVRAPSRRAWTTVAKVFATVTVPVLTALLPIAWEALSDSRRVEVEIAPNVRSVLFDADGDGLQASFGSKSISKIVISELRLTNHGRTSILASDVDAKIGIRLGEPDVLIAAHLFDASPEAMLENADLNVVGDKAVFSFELLNEGDHLVGNVMSTRPLETARLNAVGHVRGVKAPLFRSAGVDQTGIYQIGMLVLAALAFVGGILRLMRGSVRSKAPSRFESTVELPQLYTHQELIQWVREELVAVPPQSVTRLESVIENVPEHDLATHQSRSVILEAYNLASRDARRSLDFWALSLLALSGAIAGLLFVGGR